MIKKLNLKNLISNIPSVNNLPLTQPVVLSGDVQTVQSGTLVQQLDNLSLLSSNYPPKLPQFAAIKSLSPFSDKMIAAIKSKNSVIEKIQEKERNPETFIELDEKKEGFVRQSEILAVGRNLTTIQQDLFGPGVDQFSKKLEVEQNEDFVSDPLRGKLGSYWTKVNDKQFVLVDHVTSKNIIKPYKIYYDSITDLPIKSDFGITEQWVNIRASVKKFVTAKGEYSKALWKSFVLGKIYSGSTKNSTKTSLSFKPTVLQNIPFYDYVHEMPVPFSKKEMEKMGLPMSGLVSEITPEYNFYIKSYENKIASQKVLDSTLPNMYVFLSQLNSKNPNPEFNKFITLNNLLETEQDIATMKTKKEKYDIKKTPIGQYYDLYSRQYDRAIKDGVINDLNERFKNILIAHGDLDLLKSYNEKREMFPMYMDVQFSTDKTTTFAQILKDSGLVDAFVSRISQKILDRDFNNLSCQQSLETLVQERQNSNIKKKVEFSQKQLRYWELTDIIKDLADSEKGIDFSKSIYLGEYENILKTYSGKEYDFYKTLMFVIFYGKLQDLIIQKFRTYQDVVDGKKAYSETVMYRIAKQNGENGEVIQNYYFPNSNEIDVIRFIDTQVKYNKNYTYTVYAYQFVVGNKYHYSDLEVDSFDQHAAFKVTQEPSLVLFEHEYCKFNGSVIDSPPIQPDVSVVPFKGVDNQIKLLFNSNVGKFVADPVTIDPADEVQIQKYRKEKRLDPYEPIKFESDDHAAKFEVYRIEHHPTSYKDFTNKKIAVIATDVDLKTIQSATAASFVDSLKPNKKYYYTFRAIDNHGHFSNPTEVIRVELVNEKGAVFLLKDVVDFASTPKETSKQARRFIQIVPNVLQSIINEEKSGFLEAKNAYEIKNKVKLGVSDESLWGKTFRIRLTSKSTGRKVELKINFEHENKEKE